MYRLLLICLLAGAFATTSCNSQKAATTTAAPTATETRNQANRPRQGGPDVMAMAQQLGLNATQTASFKEITERYAGQFQELRKSAGGDRQTLRSQMETLRAKQDKEINALLTTDQQAAYAKMKEEQMARQRQQGGRRGGGRPGGR